MTKDLTWELHKDGVYRVYQNAHNLIGTVEPYKQGFYLAHNKLTNQKTIIESLVAAKAWVVRDL